MKYINEEIKNKREMAMEDIKTPKLLYGLK